MTKCSVKNCKNHTTTHSKKHGVTYHRFPQNVEIKEKWRKIIAMDRRDEFFKPTKSSIICSSHFSETDMYMTKKGFCRLKKCAIPQIKINNISETENFVEHELSMCSDNMKTTTSSAFASPTVSTNRHSVLNTEKKSLESAISSVSNISSVLNSPMTVHLKNELKKCYMMINKKNKLIRNLKNQNKRIRNKNISLKGVINNLKNKIRLIDKSV